MVTMFLGALALVSFTVALVALYCIRVGDYYDESLKTDLEVLCPVLSNGVVVGYTRVTTKATRSL